MLFPSVAFLRDHRDATVAAAHRAAAALVPGTRVRLRGLQRRAEFNGQCGELQPDPECAPAAAG